MTQEEIDRQIELYRREIAVYQQWINDLNGKIVKLWGKAKEIHDTHVLIPNKYETMEEWLKNVPFPELTRKSHTFRNKLEAFEAQLGCNKYQTDYHIIRHKQ